MSWKNDAPRAILVSIACAVIFSGCAVSMWSQGFLEEGIPTSLPLPLTVAPAHDQAPRWNDYLSESDPSIICTGTDQGCFHAGELRKVSLPGLPSCDGLILEDELGLFDWTCSTDGSTVDFVSARKQLTSLADLVSSSGWKTNRVTLKLHGSVIARSEPATDWWPNPVHPLPDSSEDAVTLTEERAIYVADNQDTRGYTVAADGIAVVFPAGVTLRGIKTAADTFPLSTFRLSAHFLSFEGSTDWQAGVTPASWSIDAQGNHGSHFFSNVAVNYLNLFRMAIRASKDANMYLIGNFVLVGVKMRYVTSADAVTLYGMALSTLHECVLDSLNLISNRREDFFVGYKSNVAQPEGERSVIRRIYLRGTAKAYNEVWGSLNILNGSDFQVSDLDVEYNTTAGLAVAMGVDNSTVRNIRVRMAGRYPSGLNINGSVNSTFENIWLEGGDQWGLRVQNSHGNLIRNFQIYQNTTTAYYQNPGIEQLTALPADALPNIYENGVVYNSNRIGVVVSNGKAVFRNVLVANNGTIGMRLTGNGITLSGVTVINSGSHGIVQNADEMDTRFHNVVVVNSGGDGIRLSKNTSGLTLDQVVVAHSALNGIYIPNPSTGQKARVKLTGNIILGNNNTAGGANYDCRIPALASIEGISSTTCTPAGVSDANVLRGVSLATTFVGPVGSDPVNPFGDLGIRPYDDLIAFRADGTTQTTGVPGAFGYFANPFRVWGKHSALAFPSPAHRGHCAAGDCQITDFTLNPSGGVIWNVSGTSNPSAPNASLTASQCPDEVRGTEKLSDWSGGTEYLKNAIELSGNRNGLCEAGESCLYTPHFGAHQGSGSLVECPYQDAGGLAGIRMYGFSSL